jgi:gas vesicle structural protein
VNRLDLQPQEQADGLPGLVDKLREGGAQKKTKGALSGVAESAKGAMSSMRGGDDDDDEEQESRPRRKAPAGRSAPRGRRPARRRDEDDED